ncbi:acyP [Symbiodinium natans]|uniref:acylphosphatase n=1 Tax=Symbiodinium natans TaxID=878477 RepID=A0A812MMY7_9DINO|nr:acyP [Symbiodinium natans]
MRLLLLCLSWLASGQEDCAEGECALNMLQRGARQVTMDEGLDGEIDAQVGALNGTSCSNFMLTGKVQMVHYRNWVVGKAKARGVKGWVANGGDKSYDGSHAPCSTCGCVLGHVEGSSGAVSAFLREVCRGGPPHSHVASCKVHEAPCFHCGSFYKEYRFCRTWTVEHCKSRC